MTVLELTINEKKITAAAGTTLLQACRDHDIPMLTMCHLKGLTDVGACRLCLVEIEGVCELTAIADRDSTGFVRQAFLYVAVFAALTLVAVIARFGEERLALAPDDRLVDEVVRLREVDDLENHGSRGGIDEGRTGPGRICRIPFAVHCSEVKRPG